MKVFNYRTAINQLGLDKKTLLNYDLKVSNIPSWVKGKDFFTLFLPYLKIYGDSREQDNWIEQECKKLGIKFEKLKKDKKNNIENLKEGDYTFSVVFGNKEYNYINKVTYERKGSISEFYNNCIRGRERVKNEFNRCNDKNYNKIVLCLEFGNKIIDLIDLNYFYYDDLGFKNKKNTGMTMYSTIMSWMQPNNNNFSLLQAYQRTNLLSLILQDMFYYFRNEIRNECIEKNLIEKMD